MYSSNPWYLNVHFLMETFHFLPLDNLLFRVLTSPGNGILFIFSSNLCFPLLPKSADMEEEEEKKDKHIFG